MNGPLRAVPRRLKSGTAKTVPAVPAAPALNCRRNSLNNGRGVDSRSFTRLAHAHHGMSCACAISYRSA